MKRKLLQVVFKNISILMICLLAIQATVAQNDTTIIDFQGSTIEIADNLSQITINDSNENECRFKKSHGR